MKLTALYYHGKRIEALYFGNKPIAIFGYINISMKDTIDIADDSFVRGAVVSKENVDHSSKSGVLFADIMNSDVTFISELIFSGQNKVGLNEDVSATTVILIPFDNSERIMSVQSDVNCRVVLIVQFGKSDDFAEVSSDICAIPINILKFEINESGPIIEDLPKVETVKEEPKVEVVKEEPVQEAPAKAPEKVDNTDKIASIKAKLAALKSNK